MPKTYEIKPKRLDDPTGSAKEVEIMKLGAMHYLLQLGFSQQDIAVMLNSTRSKVQNAKERRETFSTPVKRKHPGRPSSLNDHTERHLQRVIQKTPSITHAKLGEELRLMGEPHLRSTVKRWLDKLRSDTHQG